MAKTYGLMKKAKYSKAWIVWLYIWERDRLYIWEKYTYINICLVDLWEDTQEIANGGCLEGTELGNYVKNGRRLHILGDFWYFLEFFGGRRMFLFLEYLNFLCTSNKYN